MGERDMPNAPRARALVCWNLRKEWVADQREIAAALERQAWCLEQARQSGWSVFHAQEVCRRGVTSAGRGALRGLAPRRHEPVLACTGAASDNEALREALHACGAKRAHVIGFGRSSSLTEALGAFDAFVIEDAFVDLCHPAAGRLQLVRSADAFREVGAEIVNLGDWRRSGRKWARERTNGSSTCD